MPTCFNDRDVIIRKCNTTGLWPELDVDIKWLCENISEANFYPIEMRGNTFKNIYCYICNPSSLDEELVTSCNTTGLWQEYDEHIEKGCNMFPVTYSNKQYKNKFCEMCNTIPCKWCITIDVGFTRPTDCELIPFKCSCVGPGCLVPFDIPGVKLRNIFRVADDIDLEAHMKTKQCSANQVHDQMKGICRNITCFPGKHVKGNKCAPLFPVVSNIRYMIAVDVTGFGSATDDINTIFKKSRERIVQWLNGLVSSKSIIQNDIHVLVLQTTLLIDFLCSDNKTIYLNDTLSMYARVDFFIQTPVERYGLEAMLVNTYEIPLNFQSKEIENFTLSRNTKGTIIKHSNRCRRSWNESHSDGYYLKYRSTFINRQVLCQQIIYETDEYVFNQNKQEIELIPYNVRLKPDQFWIDENKKVAVCLTDILLYLSQRVLASKSSFELALEIMAISCSCISMLCLLLTFITYCCLKPLQTLPGINNMCLVFSLFIAQACLQFGTIWTNYVLVCKIIGIILHMFWLATFGCMNVCSFHMYRIFNSLKPMQTSNNNKTLVRYMCYSYGAPALIVIANIAVHLVLSDGRDFGYGIKMCFISDRLSQFISFVLPVVLICIGNICMFSITVYKIHSRPNIGNTRNNRNDLAAYVKLFALTGSTWIGQIIDSFFPMSVFSYIVTIFTGLQGLFIFVFFICNTRVVQIYRASLEGKTSKTSQTRL